MKRIKIEGRRFGHWKVGKYLYNKQNHSYYQCVCDCGNVVAVSSGYMRRGTSKSCGCFSRENQVLIEDGRPHWFRIKRIMRGMKHRCEEADKYQYLRHSRYAYKNYMARGISICKEWRHNNEKFYAWCMQNGYRPGLEIDRIDNDMGYSPDNCRFITRKENCRRQKKVRRFNINGQEIVTIGDLASHLKCSTRTTKLITKHFSDEEIGFVLKKYKPKLGFHWIPALKRETGRYFTVS